MMIFDDAAHNSQTESRATLLSRKIRQKEFLLEFAGYAVARIGYGNLNGVSARHQCR